MILVLVLCALVIGAFGALIGSLLARYMPRFVLFLLWGALVAGGVYTFLQGGAADEFERAGSTILVFAVLLPFMIGSVITGSIGLRRPKRKIV